MRDVEPRLAARATRRPDGLAFYRRTAKVFSAVPEARRIAAVEVGYTKDEAVRLARRSLWGWKWVQPQRHGRPHARCHAKKKVKSEEWKARLVHSSLFLFRTTTDHLLLQNQFPRRVMRE